jgi:hypothetical protein
MKRKSRIAAKVCFLLLFSFHLRAAVYTYNATIDISSPFNVSNSGGQWNYLWIISGAPTFALQAGDTVQGTISFAGNEALQFLGPQTLGDIIWSWYGSGTANTTSTTTTLNGITGQLSYSNPTYSSGSSPSSSIVAGLSQVWTPSVVSFTGFSYSSTLTSGSGNFGPYFFSAYSPNGSQPGAIAVVPEPSAISLIGLGIILLPLMKKLANMRTVPEAVRLPVASRDRGAPRRFLCRRGLKIRQGARARYFFGPTIGHQ